MAQDSSTKSTKIKPTKVMALYKRVTRLPMGKKLFSMMVARMAPYFSTINPLITELRA